MYAVLVVCDLKTEYDHSALADYLSLRDGETINKYTTRLMVGDLQEFFDDVFNITYEGDVVEACFKDINDPDSKLLHTYIRKKGKKPRINKKFGEATYSCE